MSMAREFKASPRSRPHTTMTGIMTHHTKYPNPTRPIKGAHTRTDKEPMSTGEYKGHVRRYESHVNGAGNRH